MTQDELRKACSRLFHCRTINDSYDLLDLYINVLFEFISSHHPQPVKSVADADAKMVCQMIWTKTLHIKGIISGIEYIAKNGTRLNKIIDPTVVACLVRNVYETISTFNLIYRNTKTPDEKIILYNLWTHAGLKYREKFDNYITTSENSKKSIAEKAEMAKMVSNITETELYKNLSSDNQKKIRIKLSQKDYKITFENNDIVFVDWQKLISIMSAKEDLLGQIYNYFSLYAHPSYVSVFQFRDMFKKDNSHFLEMTNFNLKILFSFLSIFIADYINLFPEMLPVYNHLNEVDQIVINFHNTFIRNSSYSINDTIKRLG